MRALRSLSGGQSVGLYLRKGSSNDFEAISRWEPIPVCRMDANSARPYQTPCQRERHTCRPHSGQDRFTDANLVRGSCGQDRHTASGSRDGLIFMRAFGNSRNALSKTIYVKRLIPLCH